MQRALEPFIIRDLSKKMVFLGGPRQVGKTTLAGGVLKNFPYKKSRSGVYLNWDFDEDQHRILEKKWDQDHQLVVFDELHKYPRWKNWIKGLYDKTHPLHHFLVTGSARLDVYRRGGDSLFGRYHYWRLHPLSLDELPPGMSPREGFKRLMCVGGFPEPFLDGNVQEARRWRRERFKRILKEDVRDLESVKKIQDLSLFAEALRHKGASPLSLFNMAQKIQVSPKTLKTWLEILNKMYLCFSVFPYTTKVPRSVQKPQKVYFFDNADLIADEGTLFENLVATHLLKKIHFLEDSQGLSLKLLYIRDKESREVDFVILKNNRVFALIEVKWAEEKISKSLQYYSQKLKPTYALQIVARLRQEYSQNKLRVLRLKKALQVLFNNTPV